MPILPEPCLVKGCKNYATSLGRCSLKEHRPKAFFGNARKDSLPKDWTRRRNYILQRDKFICYICNRPGADSVDHVDGREDHSEKNLKAVHQNVEPFCHRSKTAQEGHQAQREGRAKQWGASWAEKIRKDNGLE